MYFGNNNYNSQLNQIPNYNPYYPQTVNPYPNNCQQPKMNTNKIFVSGIEDVKMRILEPNSDFIFFDNEKSMIYRKVVDATGHFDVKAYDVTEHKEKQPETPQTINPQEFVRKEDFEALQAKFEALTAQINERSVVSNDDTRL